MLETLAYFSQHAKNCPSARRAAAANFVWSDSDTFSKNIIVETNIDTSS
jgi:hypothetical protein